MSIWITIMDLALCAVLLGIAARALAAPTLFEAVTLFILFGIFISLAWVRLGAPDIALAEAGIGAGFTGALCVAALVWLRQRSLGDAGQSREGADDE